MKAEEIAKNIVNLLEKSGRIEDLGPIVSFLSDKVHKGEDKIVVWLPEKVANTLEQKIDGTLKEKFGKKIKIEYRYDPRLIGGLIIEAGEKIYDLSLKGRLQRLLENERI